MTTVIQSLKVEGNVPCPMPADIGKPPPSIAKRKPGSARYHENYSARPVKIKPNMGPRLNTEEDLKSIMLQAKSPPIIGPTPVTKRFTYFSRIKQLNDGMYNHAAAPGTEAKTAPQSLLKLEGRKVDASDQHEADNFTDFNSYPNTIPALPECEPTEEKDGANDVKHARNSKSSLSAKSGRSVRSVQSSKSDPAPTKSMMLPSLTIGAARPMTRGDYITESKEEAQLFSLGVGQPNKEAVRGEQEDYEFRFHTPRKLHLRLESRDMKTSDSTGNYGSLSLTDLKACLHVNHQNDIKTQHQDDIIQGYIQQFKSSRNGSRMKINAYKMLKNSPRTQNRASSPRYQFKNVDSYLRFNRHKDTGNLAKTLTNSAIHGEPLKPSYSDTVVLKVVSELNNPPPARVSMAASGSLVPQRSTDDILKVKQTGGLPAPKSRNSSANKTREKEVLQNVIYVPSGQTGLSNAFCQSLKTTEDIDLDYQVNLRSPCQPGHGRRVRHIHVQRLPDIVAIVESVLAEVLVIRDSYVLNRFGNNRNLVEWLHNSTWPAKLYNSMSQPEMFCGQKQDALTLIWKVALNYTTFINYIKKDELIWSGFTRGIRRRAVTFELILTLLEMNEMSNLLCTVKQYAEAYSIQLPDDLMTDLVNKQNQRVKRKRMNTGDRIGAQVLDTMAQDFLPFIKEYFETCDI